MHNAIPAMLLLMAVGVVISIVSLGLGWKAFIDADNCTVADEDAPRYLLSTSCCDYTHESLPALIAELQLFVDQTSKQGERFYETGDWSSFPQVYPDLETPFANNTYLQNVASLRTRIMAIKAANSNTLEDIQLNYYLKEVDFWVNLSKVNGLWMQYGLKHQYVAWIDDPFATIKDIYAVIPDYEDEPDFVDKVLALYTQLTAKLTRWKAMGERNLAGETVHAALAIETQWNLGTGLGYDDVYTLDYESLCTDTMSGADLTACLALAVPLNALEEEFFTWFGGDYRDNCTDLRPNTAAGLKLVPNGSVIYDILQTYHLGYDANETALYELGITGVEEVLTLFDELSVNLDYADTADLLDGLDNPDDDVLYQCTNVTDDVISASILANVDIQTKLSGLFGFLPRRSALEVGISGNAATFLVQGGHNRTTKYWTSGDYYNIGRLGTCNSAATGWFYYDRSALNAVAARTAYPGHALQSALAAELDCSFADQIEGNTEAREGWAVHAMYVCIEMGCYATNATLTGYYRTRSLYDTRLREDTCLHANKTGVTTCTTTQAQAHLTDLGFTSATALFETVRALIMPAQGLAARLGDLKLQALRTAAQEAIEDANKTFSPREFYNVILRFGPSLLANETELLVDTYVKVAVGNATVSTDFGRDLIPSKLYSSGNPSVGFGSNEACAVAAFEASAHLNLTSYANPSFLRVRYQGRRYN